jgi:flagellar hook-associated protein 2
MSSVLPTSQTSSSLPSTSSSSAAMTPSTASAGQGVITSTGLGSGLDINSIVTQLVAAESAGPTLLFNQHTSQIQTQVSAYGQLQSAVSALQASLATLSTSAQFQANAATVGDTTIASATANGTSVPGQYSLEVDQLATGAQLISNPVASSTTAIGTGTLTISVGSQSVPVTISPSNNSLAGIAAAINAAGATHGLSASLLTANDGVRLVLTSATTGAANAVTVTQTGGDGGLAALAYDPANSNTKLTQTQAAQDAQIKLNGFAYNSASNNVTGALTGVTISLKAKTATGVTTPLTIAADQSGAQQAVQTFVTSYNTLANAVSQLTSFDPTTSTAGPLLGDALTNNLVNQIRSALNTSVASLKGGPFSSLAEIGIVANPDGTLGVNTAKVGQAFTSNYAAVTQLFSGPDGVATKLNSLLNSFTQPSTGIFAEENASLQKSLAGIQTSEAALSTRMAALQSTLLAQYNAMDALVAQLKNTGTTVQAELGSIYYPGKATTAVP